MGAAPSARRDRHGREEIQRARAVEISLNGRFGIVDELEMLASASGCQVSVIGDSIS